MSSPRVAICVGHSRQIDGRAEGGAVSAGNVSEHKFNTGLASFLVAKLGALGIDAFTVSRYSGDGYTAAQKWLGKYLKERGATLAIELHFNSAAEAAHGHEWLHYKSSPRGKAFAACLATAMADHFPKLKSRGFHPPENGRGDEFLRLTPCPAVICEPFFGSNNAEWQFFSTRQSELADAIVDGIKTFIAHEH